MDFISDLVRRHIERALRLVHPRTKDLIECGFLDGAKLLQLEDSEL